MTCCNWSASGEGGDTAIPTSEQVVALVLARRDDAESALLSATGGESLCHLREGSALATVKVAEGRVAALAELRRSIAGAPEARPWALARVLLARWEAEARRAEARGPAWLAYRTGGVEELRCVVRAIDALFTPTGHTTG